MLSRDEKGPRSDEPDALDVVLANLHIDVYRPEVPPFGMRVDDALEERPSPFWFAQFIFQLGKFGDGLEVWRIKPSKREAELRECHPGRTRTFALF
jgi:hypothetical protein